MIHCSDRVGIIRVLHPFSYALFPQQAFHKAPYLSAMTFCQWAWPAITRKEMAWSEIKPAKLSAKAVSKSKRFFLDYQQPNWPNSSGKLCKPCQLSGSSGEPLLNKTIQSCSCSKQIWLCSPVYPEDNINCYGLIEVDESRGFCHRMKWGSNTFLHHILWRSTQA